MIDHNFLYSFLSYPNSLEPIWRKLFQKFSGAHLQHQTIFKLSICHSLGNFKFYNFQYCKCAPLNFFPGLNLQFGRVPIASTDFSGRVYSYNDVANDYSMQNFNLTKEDFQWKVSLFQRNFKFTLKNF